MLRTKPMVLNQWDAVVLTCDGPQRQRFPHWPPFGDESVRLLQCGAPRWVEVVVRLAVEGPAEALGAAPVRTGSPQRQTHPPVGHVGADERARREGHLPAARDDDAESESTASSRRRLNVTLRARRSFGRHPFSPIMGRFVQSSINHGSWCLFVRVELEVLTKLYMFYIVWCMKNKPCSHNPLNYYSLST